VTERSPTQAEVVALARRTPITRGAIAELARKVPAELARKTVLETLDSAGANASMVLAFVAAVGGEKLDQPVTRTLLPEVLSLDHVGPLVHATEGSPLDVLVAFLEDKRGDLELECLAMLLAADTLASDPAFPAERRVPPALLTRGRWLARHKLTSEASIHLGGAALRLRDADLLALAAPHVNRAKRNKKVIDEALATSRLPPLEALADTGGARVSSGFTVRHVTPAVGRNDPCPCGSGKKYKKCHALEGAPPVSLAPQRLDAMTLGADQAALLRPSEIADLETTRLSTKAFVAAFGRVVDLRLWDVAVRMIGEARARKDLAPEATSLVLEALRGAYDSDAHEAAERLYALLPPEFAEGEALAIDLMRSPPDLLARIERAAEAALRTDADGGRGIVLASSLLRWLPALGIYVARGALHEGRTAESMALLTCIEDARDRLLLPPFEPWWDLYDAFFESKEERKEQAKDEEKREKMKEALRQARAASRKTAAELEKLQARVAELDESLASGPRSKTKPAATPDTPAPQADLLEERRRLKAKIDELQRIIGEGQEERRELRRQLAQLQEEQEEDEAPLLSAKHQKASRAEEPDADPEGLHETGTVDAPRGILVPRFSDRAAKALTDLAADAADGVLTVVSALAAGKPNAWGGVKQLTKVRTVLSARAGIHHRVLFSVKERELEVLEVIHRRDLEQVVARLARVS
jgi:hypothetical protein